MATATAPPPAAAAPALAVRLVIDGAGTRVLFAEAGQDAVAFLSSLLANPLRAAVELQLQEDPTAAAAGCFGNLLSAGALLLHGAAASAPSSSPSRAPPPASSPVSASRPPTGTGIMSRRLYRCDGLGCRCSDVASRVPGSPCPCRSCHSGGAYATRDTELHFLEACFYRRPDGSAASSARGGAGRGGDTFYRCHARDGRHDGRDFIQCRYRVTDEHGVECPLCHSLTTVSVKLAKGSSARPPRAAAATPGLGFVVMDDLSVRAMAEGMSRAALLAELGVADPASVRDKVVPFGSKQGLSIIWASLQMKTVLTEVFLRTNAECWEDTTKGHPERKKLKYGPPEYLPLLEQIGSTSFVPVQNTVDQEEDQEDADGFEVRQESLMSIDSHKRGRNLAELQNLKHRGPPYYDKLKEVFQGVVVDGSTAFGTGDDSEEEEEEEEYEQDEEPNAFCWPYGSPCGSIVNAFNRMMDQQDMMNHAKIKAMKKVEEKKIAFMREQAQVQMEIERKKIEMKAEAEIKKEERHAKKAADEMAILDKIIEIAIADGWDTGSIEYMALAYMFYEEAPRTAWLRCTTSDARLNFMRHWIKANILQ